MILINPVMMYYLAVSSVSAAAQMRQDWRNIPCFPSLPELLGLVPHFSPEAGGAVLWALTFGFVPAIVGIVGYGLYRAWKEGGWLILATVTLYLLGALVIALLMGHAYGYYKHGVVTLFAFLLSFAYGLEGFCGRGSSRRRLIPVLVGGIFLCLNLLAFKTTYARERPVFVPPKLAAVGDVKSLVKSGEIVFIDEEVMGLQLWTSYFLWGIPLSVPPTYEPWGWYGLDEGTRTSRWMAQQGTLQSLGNEGLRKSVRLRMTLVPIVAPLTLEVFIGEEWLGAFIAEDTSRPATFLTRPFSPHEGATLKIRSLEGCFKPNGLFGSPDHRCLSARFLEVGLIEVAP
jgi:hypothetical protein